MMGTFSFAAFSSFEGPMFSPARIKEVFEEIEETIKDKFNYLMIMNIDLLEEYKYQITSIDFKKKKVYFKPCYY